MEKPKRPYYDIESAEKRRAARIAALKRALGFGTAIVVKPSDETMKRLDHAKSAQQ